MKCKECKYKEPIEETDNLLCTLTQEEHEPTDECNCGVDRLTQKGLDAKEELIKLLSTISKPLPDIKYVYDTLLEINANGAYNKLTELIKYLEQFV